MNERSGGTRQTPSHAVVEAVASREGVAPTAIDPPLYAVIDPDALDVFFESGGGQLANPVWISFEYCDYVVTIGPDGEVDLESTGDDGSPADGDGPPVDD